MNKYLRAISDNFIFFVLSAIFFLAVVPIAIKTMGEEIYGLWVVLSALMLFSNVGNLGIDAIVVKFSAEAHVSGDDARIQANRIMTAGYLIVFFMSIITIAFLLIARNLIVHNININTELRYQFQQAILWIVASIFPQFLARVPHGFLLSRLRNQAARQIELFSSVSPWAGAIVIALIEKNLVSMAAWCFFSNWLVFGLYFWASQRLMSFNLQLDRPSIKKMLRFSRYMFLENLAISLFQHFDKVVVSFTLGPALAGVYSIGTSLALRLSMITGQATEVMIPYASLKDSLDDRPKLHVVFRQLSRYISLAMAGIASLLIIWMNEVLFIWISPGYAAHYANDFRILIIAYSLLSLTRPAHQTLTGIGKVRLTAILYLFSTILMLVGLFFLSRQFGLLGAVTANLALMLLLILNLLLYLTFERSFHWRHILTDLQWGLSLPILSYGLTMLPVSSMLMYKLMETIILGIILSYAIVKDDSLFVRTNLLRIKQFISKSQV